MNLTMHTSCDVGGGGFYVRSPKCEPTHINVKTYEKFATAFGGNFIKHNLESTKGRHYF
jgi:hypothetical protein